MKMKNKSLLQESKEEKERMLKLIGRIKTLGNFISNIDDETLRIHLFSIHKSEIKDIDYAIDLLTEISCK